MLILASRSPQRRAILEQIGVPFEVVDSEVEEIEAGDPPLVVVENALRKARAVAATRPPGDLVLGADTIIAHAGEVVGKPSDADAARAVMRRLAGEAHQVLGGIALVARDGGERTACVATDVVFRELSDAEIDRYVACGEWQDRSGGYAIQQKGATLVERIEGDYLNIVGLSVVELLKLAPELRV
jgi:septum formation protein